MRLKALIPSLLMAMSGTLSSGLLTAADVPPGNPSQEWVAGHWEWTGTEYVWRAGHWQATGAPAPVVQNGAPPAPPPPTSPPADAPPAQPATPPPQPTAANQQWIPGHWEQGATGWQYISGHYESPPAGPASAPVAAAPAPAPTSPPAPATEPQVIIVQSAPPPERREYITDAPSPDHVWIRGYWSWQGGGWIWISGHWERRHHHDAVWEQGHWVQTSHGWEWHDGYWR